MVEKHYIGLYFLYSLTWFLLPNVMFSDDNSKQGNMVSDLGLFASGMLMASGVTGIFHIVYFPLKISKILACIGIFSQVLSFILPDIIYGNKRIRDNT